MITKFRNRRYLERNCKAIESVFDESWYLKNNPDVSENGYPAIQHYLLAGAFELRSPHILFDEAWYMDRNPDVYDVKIPGLLHYMLWGSKEGRSPHPLIAENWIKGKIGEGNELSSGLEYLLNNEKSHQVSPHPLFDAKRYRSKYMKFEVTDEHPIVHYLGTGFDLMNNPHPLFSEQWYQENYPDVSRLKVAGLVHYVKHGYAEGRSPHPFIDPMKLQRVLLT